jgi:Tetracyclin repressor-like, C-terminal domain
VISGVSRWACESPVTGCLGGSSGAGSTPGIGSVCETSKTNVVLKKTRRPSPSSPSLGLAVTHARIRIACSPLRTARPSLIQAWNPATCSGTIAWEELRGGDGLRRAQRESSAIDDAFAAVKAVARERSLRGFDVDDAVLVLVSLTFSPLSQQATLMAALGRDLADPEVRRRHVRLVVEQMLQLLCAPNRR